MVPHIARIGFLILVLGVATAARADAAEEAWIAAKVKLAMLGAYGFDGLSVDVDALDGVVILHGVVPGDADRTRMGAIAMEVEGVRGVRNLIAVVPALEYDTVRVSDERVGLDVKRVLASDPELAGSAIEVESVHGGIVLLTGRAESLAAHRAALADAREVGHVARVESGIRSPDEQGDRRFWEEGGVERREDQSELVRFVTDAWITVRAKLRLMRELGLSPFSIGVDTEEGVVTLSGMVESRAEREVAESELMQIDGVLRVTNDLQVEPTLATNI